MPTPFTHLMFAQKLLRDPQVLTPTRALLSTEKGAFLLGSIAADARVGAGAPRETTHFYAYGQDITEHPWRVMLAKNPALNRPHSAAHRAFVAGYVAHLAMDEYWSLNMVHPHFVLRDWGTRYTRFLMLHVILIYMDQRDLLSLEPWQSQALSTADPRHWLTFISDDDLRAWRELIHDQIRPGGVSQTFEIFAPRIGITTEELRAAMDTDAKLEEGLWRHIPKATLAQVEDGMYAFARQQLADYLAESAPVLTRESDGDPGTG